jgi:hypothetical protein
LTPAQLVPVVVEVDPVVEVDELVVPPLVPQVVPPFVVCFQQTTDFPLEELIWVVNSHAVLVAAEQSDWPAYNPSDLQIAESLAAGTHPDMSAKPKRTAIPESVFITLSSLHPDR